MSGSLSRLDKMANNLIFKQVLISCLFSTQRLNTGSKTSVLGVGGRTEFTKDSTWLDPPLICIWRGISCTYSDTSCLLFLLRSGQPNSLNVSFQLQFLGQIWCRLVCFPFVVCDWSKECNWVHHFTTKAELPLSPDLFFFFLKNPMMTKALHHCECVICLPTCVHMLASPSGSCSQPPGPREISHDAVERHSVWLTLEHARGGWGTARGLAGRCDASWHVAESVILRGRPGIHTQKKLKWYLTSPFVVFASVLVESLTGPDFMPVWHSY